MIITQDIPWDLFWMGQAMSYSLRSKDPSTKVGSVIVRPNKTMASSGYNGFPRGVDDTADRLHDRTQKYNLIVHAEMNALHNCQEDLTGYTVYSWPIFPCAHCFPHLKQRGVSRFVGPWPTRSPKSPLWQSLTLVTIGLLRETSTDFTLLDLPDTYVSAQLSSLQHLLHCKDDVVSQSLLLTRQFKSGALPAPPVLDPPSHPGDHLSGGAMPS